MEQGKREHKKPIEHFIIAFSNIDPKVQNGYALFRLNVCCSAQFPFLC